jgi:hypothetical protein
LTVGSNYTNVDCLALILNRLNNLAINKDANVSRDIGWNES